MTVPAHTVRQMSSADLHTHLLDLCRILIDSVADGAAISFMSPLSQTEADAFWTRTVRPAVEQGAHLLFGAFVEGRLWGTVQLIMAMPPNQPHRAEISKMIVHPTARQAGLGTALMTAALKAAKDAGKSLVTLDTRTGDVSERLYRRVGFEQAGIIPDFAYDPDGQTRHATTYMYRYL